MNIRLTSVERKKKKEKDRCASYASHFVLSVLILACITILELYWHYIGSEGAAS